jgi:YidC/Oxa1 family membrane protein insertase
MLRTLIAALFVLVPTLLIAQDRPDFVHEFGKPGEKGSFRVGFDDRGASVFFVQLMDHFSTVEAGKKPAQELASSDYMLLVGDGQSVYSLQADEVGTSLFGGKLASGAWKRSVQDGAVSFSIEADNGLSLRKTYRHRQEQRGLAIEWKLDNRGTSVAAGQQLLLSFAAPALANRTELAMFGTSAWAIAAPVDGDSKHVGASADGAIQELLTADGRALSMVGSSNRFFGGFLFPLDAAAAASVTRIDVESLPLRDNAVLEIKARSMPRALVQVKLQVPAQGASTELSFGCYLGPKSFAAFEETPENARFLPILDVDLEPPCCGSVVVPGGRFMATMLVQLLGLFHGMTGVWGVAIMLLTILVRGALAPLNFRMQKSMRAYGKRMAELKPKLDKIKEKYADDPKAHQQAMIAFQREHKLMPPIGGCLPIFLTMPIYIGLFTALRTSYDLRQQGFLFMSDLSAPDALFPLPFWPGLFNVLPLVWIALMVILQSRMPLPTDPQQRQMQQIMRYMPLMFGVMLYNYASGLMVYMVTSMIWTFGESAVTKKILGPIDPNAASLAPQPMM